MINELKLNLACGQRKEEGYFGIDTLNGIKLIREDDVWIHLYLATGDDTLQIEVYDPDENPDTQAELIEFSRNLVASCLS